MTRAQVSDSVNSQNPAKPMNLKVPAERFKMPQFVDLERCYRPEEEEAVGGPIYRPGGVLAQRMLDIFDPVGNGCKVNILGQGSCNVWNHVTHSWEMTAFASKLFAKPAFIFQRPRKYRTSSQTSQMPPDISQCAHPSAPS